MKRHAALALITTVVLGNQAQAILAGDPRPAPNRIETSENVVNPMTEDTEGFGRPILQEKLRPGARERVETFLIERGYIERTTKDSYGQNYRFDVERMERVRRWVDSLREDVRNAEDSRLEDAQAEMTDFLENLNDR